MSTQGDMRRIYIFDTTLRDGEQSPGCTMNQRDKLMVAELLEALKVDIIEAGFAIASQGDFESVRAIAGQVREAAVASLCRALEKDIDRAWEAVKDAAHPRIHTFLATSPIHMSAKLKMTTVNIPDTVGYAVPPEFGRLVRDIFANVPNIGDARISVHCHNDLGMGVANSLSAVEAGATQVECTINGIGERAGNAALEEIVMALKTRHEHYRAYTAIDTTKIYATSRCVVNVTGSKVQANKAIVGENAFAHEAGIHQHGVLANPLTYEIMTPESIGLPRNKMVLGKHSGKHAFESRLRELGFQLDAARVEALFAQFKSLADRKKTVSDADIEALAHDLAVGFTGTAKLDRFSVIASNVITPVSTVRLQVGGDLVEKVAAGDGPVNASFRAICDILKIECKLEDFQLSAVTEGMDAQCKASVRVRFEDRAFHGSGISTDIVEASILAYLQAINAALEAKAGGAM